MMHEHAIAAAKITHRGARLLDHADRLMSQDQRRLAPDVPGHNVARADSAGARAHQDIVGADLGAGAFLDADIAEIVEPCDLHEPAATLWGALRLVNRARGMRPRDSHAKFSLVPRPQCPPIAADVIAEVGDRVVLIARRNFPAGWAIPGGFVEIGERVEDAAVREVREETTLEVEIRALLGVYSRPDRDPRGHTITVVYVGRGRGTPRAADDAREIGLFDPRAPGVELAFDHAEILADYVRFLDSGALPAPWRR